MATTSSDKKMLESKSDLLLLALFSCFLERFSFFAQNTALTFLAKDMGVTTQEFGYLQSVFGICLFLGAPVIGRLSDVIGSRLCLALVLICNASVYGLLCLSSSFSMLILAQIPSFFCQSMPVHQILVGELTDDLSRPAALGKIGMSIGLAVVVGPLTGGQLTKFVGARPTLFIFAVLCTLHAVAALVLLPAKTTAVEKTTDGPALSKVLDVKKMRTMFGLPGVLSLLAIVFIVCIPLGVHRGITGLLLVNHFHLVPVQIGYVSSCIGTMLVVVQGFGVSRLSKSYTEKEIIKFGVFFMASGFLGMYFVRSVLEFCIVQAVMLCGLILALVFIQTLSSKLVIASDRGTMTGLVASLQALAFAVGPTLGAFLISRWSLPGYAMFGFTLCSGLFITLFTCW